ncbi:MAG: hypothetical protein RLP12_04695, partial [Ekhidna sp.]
MPKYLILLFLIACGPDRSINSISSLETKILENYKNLSTAHRLQIGSPDEPGEKLALCLTFVGKVSG